MNAFDEPPPRHLRTNGLDTLRAAAIVLVFCYHYPVFVSGSPTFGWLSRVGWTGVDLFFVLSGYLIGNQVFAVLAKRRPISTGAFYARRALRTWPAFWVVLALYFVFAADLGGRTPPPLWRFLSFTQNWQLKPGTAFSHAWSLCIEEQFYFVLPLMILAGVRLRASLRHGWLLIGTLLTVGIVARGVLWMRYGRADFGELSGYYPNVYYASLCRFDEFLPGIALAMFRNFHPLAWKALRTRSLPLFAVGAIATGLMLYGAGAYYFDERLGYAPFMSIPGYSLIAMAYALLVASALCPASPLARLHVPGAALLARFSYSIYLTHKAVAHVLAGVAAAHTWPDAVRLATIVLACLAVGALLHVAVEAPFMRVRDRVVPRLFPRVAEPSSLPSPA